MFIRQKKLTRHSNKFGSKYKSKAEIAGGIILVLIGLKIFLEELAYSNSIKTRAEVFKLSALLLCLLVPPTMMFTLLRVHLTI